LLTVIIEVSDDNQTSFVVSKFIGRTFTSNCTACPVYMVSVSRNEISLRVFVLSVTGLGWSAILVQDVCANAYNATSNDKG